MAQVAVRLEAAEIGRDSRGLATRLVGMVSHIFASQRRSSRERDDLAVATSLARLGRETGVKC